MLLNTFSRNTTKLWTTKMVVSKCPCLTFSEAMPCLDAKISLVLTIVPHSAFYLIVPCNTHPYRQSHKATKIHTLTPPTYELFFQNSSKKEWISLKPHEHRGGYWRKKLPWTILEEQFSVPRYAATSKRGNSVISLLWQLWCRCNIDHNKFSSLSNTTVVAVFSKSLFMAT